MLHYYLNIFDNIPPDKHIKVAYAVANTAQNQFKQFEKYLKNSIDALKKKEITAVWEKVPTQNLAELKLIGGLYKYEKQTVISVINNKKEYYRIELVKGEPNYKKEIEYQIGENEGSVVVTEDDYKKGIIYLEGIKVKKIDAVRWGFADIELIPAWISFEKNTSIKDKNGIEYKIISVENDDITISGDIPHDAKLFYNDIELSFKIKKSAKYPYNNIEVIKEDEGIFYSEKGLDAGSDEIKNISYRIKEFINFNEIVYDSNPNEKLEILRNDNSSDMTIILNNANDYGKKARYKQFLFEITKLQNNNSDNWKIQLKETNNNNDNDDELYALSPLRYFFSDNVTIIDNKKNKYYIDMRGSNQEEFQIVLKRDPKPEEKTKFRLYCHPEGLVLNVKVDVRPLERQLESIRTLKLMPHQNHEMLLRLFEKKDGSRWEKPKHCDKINDWFVLKDEKRSGCTEQRDFISKALCTPDFAILEGPPGSGKTTAILELICQFIFLGKRVLLCGSTNVAIDNVLERLIEKKDNNISLLEQLGILPVRIGTRGDDSISEFQIDKLIGDSVSEEQQKLKEKILLNAANLVCGTTMGIINHPKFRDQRRNDETIIPDFDYLIIDESSKTTFQEFLVPALYAKKWILAGDVMQLSPFTDQESIEFNFEQISVNNKILDNNIQQAVFILEKLRVYFYYNDKENNKKYVNRFILPYSSGVIKNIKKELASGRIEKFTHEEIFIFITKKIFPFSNEDSTMQQKLDNQVILRTPETVNYLELTAANIILVDIEIFNLVQNKLPSTHAVLYKQDWEETPHAFYHNIFQQQGKFGYKQKWNIINNSFDIVREINKDFKERNWAKEIAWRINSENQLRLAEGSKRIKALGFQIDEYTPYSVDKESFEEARNIIAAMSFPSILESLVTGIKGKKPKEPSTISDGFYDDDLIERKTTLTYQHRMHPDISVFPRERYYRESSALLDLESPIPIREARNWGYKFYNQRSVWVDVSPKKGRGSRNIFEVEAIMHYLKNFLDYAVNNEQPEGKKWEVACLAFYRGQEEMLREGGEKHGKHIEGLRSLPGIKGYISSFRYNEDKKMGKYPVLIRLCSVDRFQGHEADIVFLSMSQTERDGFLDNPNRLNVSITRAKFQMLIFGKYEYFSKYTRSDDLRALAKSHENAVIEWRHS